MQTNCVKALSRRRADVGADLEHDMHLPRGLQMRVLRPPKGVLC